MSAAKPGDYVDKGLKMGQDAYKAAYAKVMAQPAPITLAPGIKVQTIDHTRMPATLSEAKWGNLPAAYNPHPNTTIQRMPIEPKNFNFRYFNCIQDTAARAGRGRYSNLLLVVGFVLFYTSTKKTFETVGYNRVPNGVGVGIK